MSAFPCNTCGAPAVRDLGAESFCASHLGNLYRSFQSPVFSECGLGLPGHTTDDHDLKCVRCDATWYGIAGEECAYCINAYMAQLEWQATLLLRAPEVDPDDATWHDRMAAWVERLKRGVEAGLITDQQARNAIAKEQRDLAA